jgi:SSS family solute:Na+ symporter
MSAVFGLQMEPMLIILGVVVTLVAFAGGSWAVLASDFVQAFLIITITICTAIMTLAHDKIGGLDGLLDKVPSAHWNWSELARPELIFVWVLATLWLKFSDENNMERATMYLMTRSDKDARKMVLIPLIGTLLGPLVWFIPSMAATILHPNLAAEFPQLETAARSRVSLRLDGCDAARIARAVALGDARRDGDEHGRGLEQERRHRIRSFYKPVFKPLASEKHLLVAGKICTLIFGAIIIVLRADGEQIPRAPTFSTS